MYEGGPYRNLYVGVEGMKGEFKVNYGHGYVDVFAVLRDNYRGVNQFAVNQTVPLFEHSSSTQKKLGEIILKLQFMVGHDFV